MSQESPDPPVSRHERLLIDASYTLYVHSDSRLRAVLPLSSVVHTHTVITVPEFLDPTVRRRCCVTVTVCAWSAISWRFHRVTAPVVQSNGGVTTW